MDTDDLTEMAWGAIVSASQVSDYNTPQKLDRAIRWMLGCHKPKGKGKYGREYAKES